jgi:hypothetical protein
VSDLIKDMLSKIFPAEEFDENFFKWECTIFEDSSLTCNEDRFAYEITLSGEAISLALTDFQVNLGKGKEGLAEKLWSENSWSFLWFLPKSIEGCEMNPDFTDIHGQKWISPLRVVPKGDDRPKLASPADLNSWRVLPALLDRAEWHWIRFRRRLKRSLTSQRGMTYSSLVELEASLNAPWTSSKANAYMLRDLFTNGDVNHLRAMEAKRQVNIDARLRKYSGSGRMRLPHISHRGQLCPYQTPESKDIGFHLFRSVGSKYSLGKEGFEPRDEENLFSLAVGLIPYLNHSDGPRLLMGGKNLKQAEHGINALKDKNPPTAMVPGLIESEIENDEILGIKNHRFKYPLGVDAFVAIMPYEGYTYEDGLVVSSDFAKKMQIPKGIHIQSEIIRFLILNKTELLSLSEIQGRFEAELREYINKKTYSYDEKLPLPNEVKGSDAFDRGETSVPHYRYRYPGKLADCDVTVVSGRPRQGSRSATEDSSVNNGGTLLQLKIRYKFVVNRPLAVGDKLTGRHGNKGVVTHILETPAHAVVGGINIPIDLMISPSALMGRKNLGQLYEMTHSLLLWVKDSFPKELGTVSRDKLLTREELAGLLPFVKKIAEDNNAAFNISLSDGRSCRAFVGFQHISRLHHHVKAKLQYRNNKGPYNTLLGQPGSGGGSAGQRLGEMENWSCLSHPIYSEDALRDSLGLLLKMRERHGDAEKTRELARSILWSLGYEVTCDAEIRCLNKKSAEKPFPEGTNQTTPLAADLLSIRDKIFTRRSDEMNSVSRLEAMPERRLAYSLKNIPKKRARVEKLLNEKTQEADSNKSANLKNLLEDAINKASCERKEELLSFFVADDQDVFLPVALDVLHQHKDAEDSFLEMIAAFYSFSRTRTERNAIDLVGGKRETYTVKGAVFAYRDKLLELLKGKMGLFRRHLLGRRLNHSGRAVIVPCPDLEIDCVRLPLSLFRGILTNETRERLQSASELEEAAFENTDAVNKTLENAPVWAILIRQPSLHRHNFMAFRVSCWDRNVIGIPPFATPGYNADFDGDTMAVFLPPEPFAKDLSHMSLLRNPGLVGTGQLALATGLDLALGWMQIFLAKKQTYKNWIEDAGCNSGVEFTSLGDLLEGLFRRFKDDEPTLRGRILELQKSICSASTGASTMTPVDFEELSEYMEKRPSATSFDEKEAENELKTWVNKNKDKNLARFVRYKVKGGESELRVMTAFIGNQRDYEDSENETPEKSKIKNSFWNGLNDDEMFRYAYASRSAMASKKLDVATAGHLSYLLAEGLYETQIAEERCSCQTDMKVSWDHKMKALYLSFEGRQKIRFPLSGAANEKNLAEALGRIAWGREPSRVSAPALLTSKDIAGIVGFWLGEKDAKGSPSFLDKNDDLWLRSPLTCATQGRNVCAACVGADPASRPYDNPRPMLPGSRVGLTAAQAIGERGTQLAMKRFHDTAGDKRTSIEILMSLLIWGKLIERTTNLERFSLLIEGVLTESLKEMPQQLIHFELALRAQQGLAAWSREIEGRWLSAIAYGRLITLQDSDNEKWGVKSRLMWDKVSCEKEGESNHGRKCWTEDKNDNRTKKRTSKKDKNIDGDFFEDTVAGTRRRRTTQRRCAII